MLCYAIPGAKIFKNIEYRHALGVKVYSDFPPFVFHGGDIAFMQNLPDTETVEQTVEKRIFSEILSVDYIIHF